MEPALLGVGVGGGKGSRSGTPRRSSTWLSALPIQCVGPDSDLGTASGLHRIHFHVVRSPLLLTFLYY